MENLEVGIGIVTCGIRKLDEKILKYNPVIFEDKERKGAAYCRNMLIKQFYDEGKDYIFIFTIKKAKYISLSIKRRKK